MTFLDKLLGAFMRNKERVGERTDDPEVDRRIYEHEKRTDEVERRLQALDIDRWINLGDRNVPQRKRI